MNVSFYLDYLFNYICPTVAGGDPFPGVYMRDIPALLKNGYRMSRPKFISPKLYVFFYKLTVEFTVQNNSQSFHPAGVFRSQINIYFA